MMNLDLIIAFALILLILIILIFTQTREQPKSSRRNVLFIISALAAVLGISLFRQYRAKKLIKELEKREERLKQKEKDLLGLKGEYETSEQELHRLKAKSDEQRSAYEKMILDINAKNKAEKERINNLSGEDLHNEFMATFNQ